MKTSQQEILASLTNSPNQYNKEHASKLAEIYKFLAKQKIEKVDTAPAVITFGKKRRVEDQTERVINDGEKMDGTKFTVYTKKGTYSLSVPSGNDFYNEVCNLLGVKLENCKEEITGEGSECSYEFPAIVLDIINTAKVFVSKDGLRENLSCVMLQITKNKLEVIATDAHRLYISRKIDITPLHGTKGNYQLLIPAIHFKKMPQAEAETFTFHVAPGFTSAAFCNGSYPLSSAKFPNYKVVIPAYKKFITFNTKEFTALVNAVIPMANKSTTQVNFSFGNLIKMHAQDVDFSQEANRQMSFVKNDIGNFNIAFNGKFLLTVLKALDIPEVKMFTDGENSKGAIFTNGLDNVLLMPLYSENSTPVYEVPMAPSDIKCEMEYRAKLKKLASRLALPTAKIVKMEPVVKAAPAPKPAPVKKVAPVKETVETDGERPPVKLVCESGSVKIVSPGATMTRRANKALTNLTYTFDKDNRTFVVSNTTKDAVSALLASNGIKYLEN